MKYHIFLMLNLCGSIGFTCTMALDSPWVESKKDAYLAANAIYVAKVTDVAVDPKDRRLNEITFKTERMIKGASEGSTFKRTFWKAKEKNTAYYGSNCKTRLTLDVGQTYIVVPDRQNAHMASLYSEKQEQEIKNILGMK